MVTLADLPTETRRDKLGRYRIHTNGKLASYTRVTTIVGALDDKEGLITWHSRVAIEGLARDPQLAAELGRLNLSDRDAIKALERRAFERGEGNAKRDRGTDLHSVLERWLTTGQVTPGHEAWLDRIARLLDQAGLTPIPDYTECVLVDDTRKIAGTCDGIARHGDGNLYLFDLKTGSFKAGACAAQLALYAAMGHIYRFGHADDGTDDTRTPMPDVSKAVGYIIHAPSDTNEAALHAVDLATGDQLVDLALKVREARTWKPGQLICSVTTEPALNLPDDPFAGLPTGNDPVDDKKRWLRDRAEAVKAHPDFPTVVRRHTWPTDVHPLTSDDPHTRTQLDQIDQFLAALEADLAVPFPDNRDPIKAHENEVLAADDPTVLALIAQADLLPVDLLEDDAGRIMQARRGRLARRDALALADRLDQANQRHAARITRIREALAEVDTHHHHGLTLLATDLRTDDHTTITADEADHLVSLVYAIDRNVLTWGDGNWSVDVTQLVEQYGSRRVLLNEARTTAKTAGRAIPTSSDDIAGDPVLAAALL